MTHNEENTHDGIRSQRVKEGLMGGGLSEAQTKKKLLNYPLPERRFSGAVKQTGRNKYFKYNITWLRIPAWRRRASWLFTIEAEELNSGLPRNNSR